jgi:hypothetical protein
VSQGSKAGSNADTGACDPTLMDDGQRMVAILNPDNEAFLFGFGKAPV